MADNLDPQFYDDEQLERELRQVLRKDDAEIELFRHIRDNLNIKTELAQSTTVQEILRVMWEDVAAFFELVTAADTLAGLGHDHELVTRHARMRANFDAVGHINQHFKIAREAENEIMTDLSEEQQEDFDA